MVSRRHLLLGNAGQVGQREAVVSAQHLAEVAHLDAALHRHLATISHKQEQSSEEKKVARDLHHKLPHLRLLFVHRQDFVHACKVDGAAAVVGEANTVGAACDVAAWVA